MTALIVLSLDIVTKSWAITALADGPKKIIGSFLQLDLAFNSGAAFSLAQTRTIFLTLFAFVVAGFVLYFGARFTSKPWGIALGLLFGGICGNLVDRILREPRALQGQVVDWIKVSHWPTFNLADTSIVLSAGLILLLGARNIKPISPNNSGDDGDITGRGV